METYLRKEARRHGSSLQVYGASKYESTLLAFATSRITHKTIDLFNIRERDLVRLPKSSLDTLSSLNIRFHDTPLYFDIKHQTETQAGSLRSSAYIYNLLNRIGDKRCFLCGCPIQEIVQGAHVWNVADIKTSNLQESEKFKAANDGNNGIWLCLNHHRLFDANFIMIDHGGSLRLSSNIDDNDREFIRDITTEHHLDKSIMSDEFIQYLDLRNTSIDLTQSISI